MNLGPQRPTGFATAFHAAGFHTSAVLWRASYLSQAHHLAHAGQMPDLRETAQHGPEVLQRLLVKLPA